MAGASRNWLPPPRQSRFAADVCCRGGCLSRNFRIPKLLVRNALEFVEKGAEVYAMTRISGLEKKPLLVGNTPLIFLIRWTPAETRRDEK